MKGGFRFLSVDSRCDPTTGDSFVLKNRGQVVAERRATETETRYISFGTRELVGQTNEERDNDVLRGNK